MVFSFHHLKVDHKNGGKWSLMEPDLRKLKELLTTWQEGMQAMPGSVQVIPFVKEYTFRIPSPRSKKLPTPLFPV